MNNTNRIGGLRPAPASGPEQDQKSQPYHPAPREAVEVKARSFTLASRHEGDILDLRDCTPQRLTQFTLKNATERGNPDGFTRLILPPDTHTLPPVINDLPRLQDLSLPGFTGTRLDLRGLRLSRTPSSPPLRISTPKASVLREILVESTQQAIKHLRFDLKTSHARKVELVDDKHHRPIPGRSYDRELMDRGARSSPEAGTAYKRVKGINLNGEVKLAGSEVDAVCRHLAVASALRRIEHRRPPAGLEGGQRGRLDYKVFSKAKTLHAALPSSLETAWREITTRSKDNHLVRLSRWHDFLCAQFSKMAPGQAQQLLVLSLNHAMHMELQTKERKGSGDDVDWVVSFYDPNRTAMPSRTVIDRSGVRRCALDELLPHKGLVMEYFEGDLATASAVVIRVDTKDLGADSTQRDTSARRVDDRFADKQLTNSDLHLLVHFDLAEKLRVSLEHQLGAEGMSSGKVTKLLGTKDMQGNPLLSRAVQLGQLNTVKMLLDVMFQSAKAGLIGSPELGYLLEAADNNGFGAYSLAEEPCAVECATVLEAAQSHALDQQLVKPADAPWIE